MNYKRKYFELLEAIRFLIPEEETTVTEAARWLVDNGPYTPAEIKVICSVRWKDLNAGSVVATYYRLIETFGPITFNNISSLTPKDGEGKFDP